ncbi:probable glycosyl hydrolase family 43 protein [Rhynchosporium agropyri]|uniref:Probable glycosyl hydrolase family 43 protein n=1 Tax=Rhynchosporium agropyri TaxID=914238 RepID=A0A1E1KI09_9HELO|nr:probable glycosyl hydrolase family 43 protein [Rhynchosporium agropyri]
MVGSSTFTATIALLVGLVSASVQIIPGATITAKGKNQHIQAHGGGIIEVNNVFYLIGENKLNGSAFQSLNCYSSTDLVTWTFVNEVLSLQSSGDLGPNRVVERPHVLYNDQTKKYVMWMHIDSSNYGEAKAGWAVSDTVCGNYKYLGSVQPLGFQSRDLNVFKDTDGTGYLLTEDRVNGLRIDKLSADYLTVLSPVFLWPEKYSYEASALYKNGNTYFMFASDQSGWDPNDNIYCTSTSLTGPWSAWKNFATPGSKTYSSQTAAIVGINGVVMYMGDRWKKANLMASTYVWLPLTLTGTTAKMDNRVNWSLDIAAGTWAPGPAETTPEAESSTNILSGGAKSLDCSSCSGGKSVGYVGGSAGGSLTFTNVTSTVDTTSTLRIVYTNGDSTQRYANVVVNGVGNVVAFVPTAGGIPLTSTLTVALKKGVNTVKFEGVNGGYAPDIDRIMVPIL